MNTWILAAIAALGIGGGFAILWREWRQSTWQERWRDAHPNGLLVAIGRDRLLLIPECVISPTLYGDGAIVAECQVLYGADVDRPR